MSSEERLYCKVFVDTGIDQAELANLIASITSGSTVKWEVTTRHSTIYINDNEDLRMSQRHKGPDAFLYSRYYLDIDPATGATRAEYVSEIARLLEALWNRGIGAVAACDFEEDLPNCGGYRPENPRV